MKLYSDLPTKGHKVRTIDSSRFLAKGTLIFVCVYVTPPWENKAGDMKENVVQLYHCQL